MNRWEKAAKEVLRSKNFTQIKKQRGYDFDAWKDRQHYVVEVKGGDPERDIMIRGLSWNQMKTLADYRGKGSKALLMFVIHDECSIFELVDYITPIPKTSQT